jgi:coenzyme F420-reducing hydrogenase beta subunit
MVSDGEGFPYPSVDQDQCIECRQCILQCPGLNDLGTERSLAEPIFYAGYICDDQIRLMSSSGGFFSLLAEKVLGEGGAVYGAKYDFTKLTVEHTRADSLEAMAPLRKSKYVQSSTVGIFQQVRQDLLAKKPVLFTGTPCQVAGLHLFLDEDHEHLITCDIICHGVPSPGLFTRHFESIQKRHGAPITEIDFRTKAKGWNGPLQLYLQIGFGEEQRLLYALQDAYYALFLANLSLRPCCYQCKYASTQRNADLTLGDFWGVKKYYPDLFDGKGTSLMLANTQKGHHLLQTLAQKSKLTPITEVKPFPPNLAGPTPKPDYRDRFFKKIDVEGWHARSWPFHLIAVSIIAKDKALGLIKRMINQRT